MTVCVGYYRCSTDTQEDSTTTQSTLCREFAEKNGHTIVREYIDEDVSASKIPFEKRPAGSELLKAVLSKRRDFDAVIVLSYDRGFRGSVDEMLTLTLLDKHKVQVISVRDQFDRSTPHGSLTHGIMRELREFESKQLGLRVREHNIGRMIRGLYPGGLLPLGFAFDKPTEKLTLTDRAQDVVTIFETYIRTRSLTQAAKELNSRSILTKGGKYWQACLLYRLMLSPIYRQTFGYGGQSRHSPETIPLLVPLEIVEEAESIMASNRKLSVRSRIYHRVYAGIVTCSECLRPLYYCGHLSTDETSEKWISRTNRRWLGLRCSGLAVPRRCNSRRVSEQFVHRCTAKALGTLFDRIIGDLPTQDKSRPKPNIAKRREQLEASKVRIREAFVKGWYTVAEVEEKFRGIDAEIAALSVDEPEEKQIDVEAWKSVLENISDIWLDLSDETRRDLLLRLEARIVVNTGERPVWIDLVTALNDEPIRASLQKWE